jgi:uncharacterized protein YjbI with pentapeptide repeats
MKKKSEFKDVEDVELVTVVLIVGLISIGIGVLISSPTIELIKTFATPLALLGVAWFVTRKLSEQELEVTQEKYRQEILTNYFNQITDLLGHEKPDDFKQEIAKAISLSALRQLDSSRNLQILKFITQIGKREDFLFDADLSGADFGRILLRGLRFGGCQLRKANFKKAHLVEINFVGADLTGADFREVSLRRVMFGDAFLSGVNFSKTNLKDACFEMTFLILADLSETDLQEVNLRGAKLVAANLTNAILKDADLNGADLSGAILKDADLRGAKCRAYFRGADLRGADLRNAIFSDDIRTAELDRADLRNTRLDGAYLKGATYTENTKFPVGFDPEKEGMVKRADDNKPDFPPQILVDHNPDIESSTLLIRVRKMSDLKISDFD